MLSLLPERCEHILLIGAHCDDIAIGAGGSVLQLCRANPGVRVSALVCTGGAGPREDEERAALAAFCPGAMLTATVLDLPDTRLPSYRDEIVLALRRLREGIDPDLILAPAIHDAHQDHRALARLVPTVFRDHFTLGYEVLKWEGDLAQPQVYFPLPEQMLDEKLDHLFAHYGSQTTHPWFDRDAFAGLARVRGVQCRSRYAEAFHLAKLVLGPAPVPHDL